MKLLTSIDKNIGRANAGCPDGMSGRGSRALSCTIFHDRPEFASHLPPRPDAAPGPQQPMLHPAPIPRPHVGPSHPPCLWMRAAKVSASLRGPAWWPTATPPTAADGCSRPLFASHWHHCNMCSPRSTFKISRWNTCNICLNQMKHTLKTCLYCHRSICNIEIYFCNI
jgi:hypothetical protein